jgi:hypothetical protein
MQISKVHCLAVVWPSSLKWLQHLVQVSSSMSKVIKKSCNFVCLRVFFVGGERLYTRKAMQRQTTRTLHLRLGQENLKKLLLGMGLALNNVNARISSRSLEPQKLSQAQDNDVILL